MQQPGNARHDINHCISRKCRGSIRRRSAPTEKEEEMGEIADAMINGEMCEWCGVWLGGDEGYPRLCAGCEEEKRKNEKDPTPKSEGAANE